VTVEGALTPPDGIRSRALVLVEGISDQHALQTLARRRGRDLASAGISIVSMGGATNIGKFLDRIHREGAGLALAGLYDLAEERFYRRSLERMGFGADLTGADLEALGFYACVADLEDELIRALGVASVERVIDDQGDLGSFRTFQRQPAQRPRSIRDQLRRFMGTQSHRKIRYATLLVEALDLTRVPRPLDRVLSHALRTTACSTPDPGSARAAT
jgi:hypothetical protein